MWASFHYQAWRIPVRSTVVIGKCRAATTTTRWSALTPVGARVAEVMRLVE
jgi:hypothetical protein